MNKSIALAVAIATVSTAAFAQVGTNAGFVLFNNSKVAAPVTFDPLAGGGSINSANYVAQLFYSTDGTSFSALGSTAAFSSLPAKAGFWGGNTKNLQFPDAIHDNQPLTLKVAVWDSTKFASWDAAVAESTSLQPTATLNAGDKFQIGSSTFAYTTPAFDNLSPDAAYLKNLKTFSLTQYTVTPEPSVVALGALGLGALLWRRRK
ncbi:MAG TPA: PEP-CTERM sorting domain-containing protein [Candidatus Limnocylindria bacterium]|jgi:hypothetical protein|nr:PEP-CTERM sorting domain-containing protein [Candidatus Limnocylindria bacterium]